MAPDFATPNWEATLRAADTFSASLEKLFGRAPTLEEANELWDEDAESVEVDGEEREDA